MDQTIDGSVEVAIEVWDDTEDYILRNASVLCLNAEGGIIHSLEVGITIRPIARA
jgi:hypothetical protein